MPAYPILRFVNSIAASPTVDLDLNLGQPFATHRDDFTVGAPTYAGDPLSIGVKWGYRTLTLVTQVSGSNATALAAYSALAKQVTVDNLLMFQLDSAQPSVFFKTYQTQPSELDMANVIADSGQSYYRLSVQLTADAAAYGLPETGSVTIANDPAATTNPCFYWFGGVVKGDLETPLYLEAPASDVRGQTRLLASQALAFSTPVSATGTNKVTNPSFETDVSNWTVSSSSTELYRALALSLDGQAVGVLRSNGVADTNAYANEFATTPGQIWSVGIWAKWRTGPTPRQFWVGIQWLNAAHSVLSTTDATAVFANTSTWTQSTLLNQTAPASTAFVRLRIWTSATANGEEMMYDAAQLENGATLPAYNPARQTAPVLVQNTALTASGAAVGGATGLVGAITTNTGDAAMAGGTYSRYTGNVADDGAAFPCCMFYAENLLPGTLVGDYRVLMRVRCGATADVWSFSFVQIAAASPNYAANAGDIVPYLRNSTGPHWLDMGVFRFPYGAPPVDPLSTFDTAYTSPGLSFAILLHTNAVAAKTVDFDGLLFVPVGVDQAQTTRYSTTAYDKKLPATTYKAIWNGQTDSRYLLDTSANYSAGIAPAADGGLPTLTPGTDNSIHYLQHIGTGYNDPRTGSTIGTDDVLTASTVMTWKYYPKYLWLRPQGG